MRETGFSKLKQRRVRGKGGRKNTEERKRKGPEEDFATGRIAQRNRKREKEQ